MCLAKCRARKIWLQLHVRSKRHMRMQLRNVRLEDSSDFIPVSQLSYAEVEVGEMDVVEGLLLLERNNSSGQRPPAAESNDPRLHAPREAGGGARRGSQAALVAT